jgi:thiamine biosynthesis protein ThiC
MGYIFESMLPMSQEEKLEQVRQQLIDQIRDGVVLLPANMRLKEVVDTPMGMDLVVEVETKKGGKLNV